MSTSKAIHVGSGGSVFPNGPPSPTDNAASKRKRDNRGWERPERCGAPVGQSGPYGSGSWNTQPPHKRGDHSPFGDTKFTAPDLNPK